MTDLVLSLFPGIDLLGRAFSEQGFSVVQGPDLLWDDPIEDFHTIAGRFDGVIGGPPCTNYSDANRNRDVDEGDRLLREFLRVVDEARPSWFLMENVRNVPDVSLTGYHVQRLDINDLDCGGRQRRLRHIQFGHLKGDIIRPPRTNGKRPVTPIPTLTTKPRSKHERHCRRLAAQGIDRPLPLRSLTKTARRRAIGNGVPLSIGRSLAIGVLEAGPVTAVDCICMCGRRVSPAARHASAACRKRMERRRRRHTRTVTIDESQSRSDVTGRAAKSDTPHVASRSASRSRGEPGTVTRRPRHIYLSDGETTKDDKQICSQCCEEIKDYEVQKCDVCEIDGLGNCCIGPGDHDCEGDLDNCPLPIR